MPKRNPAIRKYTSRGKTKYKFQVYLGQDESGRSINTTRSGFDSYAQASAAFNRLKAQGLRAKAPKKATVDEVWQLWFDSYKGGVKESTASKTLTSYKVHIKPAFGHKKISSIKTPAVQLWANQLAGQLVNYKVVVRLLGSLLEFAKRLDYCKDNPVKQILMPKSTSRPRRDTSKNYYAKEELQRFLKDAKDVGPRIYTFYVGNCDAKPEFRLFIVDVERRLFDYLAVFHRPVVLGKIAIDFPKFYSVARVKLT